MGVGTKKNQLLDDRANVLCTNCYGQGHMNSDCPSPQALSPTCRYSGGDHDISSSSTTINEGHPNYNPNIYNNGVIVKILTGIYPNHLQGTTKIKINAAKTLEILHKQKRSKPIGIMPGVVPYDLLEDLRK